MDYLSTFGRIYKVTFGQYDSKNNNMIDLFSTSELRIKATISHNANNKQSKASTVQIYNLGNENIATLEQAKSLYVKVQAGYAYTGDSNTPVRPDELPVIFLGTVLKVDTNREGADFVSKIIASPMFDVKTKAICNRAFNKGASLENVFNYLASTIPCSLQLAYTKMGKIQLIEKKTFEGSTMTVLDKLCRKYELRHYTENSTIHILDEEMKNHHNVKVTIPLSLIKGDIQTSVNLRTALQKGVTAATSVKLTTFLYSNLLLQDKVLVKIRDYTQEYDGIGEIPTKNIEVSITSLTHSLDSHAGNNWNTVIEGKSNQ